MGAARVEGVAVADDKKMICTVCGAPTRVSDTKPRDGGRLLVRQRYCTADTNHRYRTEERPVGLSVERVLVRRSGDGALAEGAFNQQFLMGNVRDGVLKRLKDDQLRDVVHKAVMDLETDLSRLERRLSPQELRDRPGYRTAIMDDDIRVAVERRLRETSRMAHVLYALSTFGRNDSRHRKGFRDAGEVLGWLSRPGNYPDLGSVHIPEKRIAPVDRWWPLGLPDPLPRLVIKKQWGDREQQIDQSPVKKQFGYTQFLASIRRAMLGRRGAEERSSNIASFVLWNLAGQQEVLTSQLAIGVMNCLRRVDDIAYLRWTAITKNIRSVSDFRDEALALITDPSPVLLFRRAAAPRLAPSAMPS